jgi:hypothetical protein
MGKSPFITMSLAERPSLLNSIVEGLTELDDKNTEAGRKSTSKLRSVIYKS